MSFSNRVFIRLRSKVKIPVHKNLYLQDVAQIVAPEQLEEQIKRILIYESSKSDGNFFVIDPIRVLTCVRDQFPDLDAEIIGTEETLIEVAEHRNHPKNIIHLAIVWLILFIGSGLAIMNFHTDVSMAEVHRRIFYLLTGEKNPYPYILQIPYSIGIGIGMIVFFNHIFKKRLNDEPSPLEVEMFLYQENLEKYARAYENRENRKGEKT